MSDYSELQRVSHETALEKGWWDDFERDEHGDPIVPDVQRMKSLMLIVTEVAEAAEDIREGNETTRFLDAKGLWGSAGLTYPVDEWLRMPSDIRRRLKPVGFPSELADIVIRVMDLCGALGIDLEREIQIKQAHNATRERKHGKRL